MDYPFVKQTSEGYVRHIRSLSARDSQRQISANTVRILLLEEQNSELRERGLREARERGGSSAPGQVGSTYCLSACGSEHTQYYSRGVHAVEHVQ